MAKHWTEVLSCHLCGKRFRSMSAEAYHRHNAKFICKGYPKDEAKPLGDILLEKVTTA